MSRLVSTLAVAILLLATNANAEGMHKCGVLRWPNSGTSADLSPTLNVTGEGDFKVIPSANCQELNYAMRQYTGAYGRVGACVKFEEIRRGYHGTGLVDVYSLDMLVGRNRYHRACPRM